ncbi:hypothetical protein CYY_007724 [Polysphondylium violaceum]|uniref:RecA family profile 1 domain-containing protein n=1 Tax=Polysphondylium violaceum TaxID=133409 RepID=A0A8J4UQP3_9MYCE|nr:hypothetical protein CYY_007724 [Polysphondylium violaceum]
MSLFSNNHKLLPKLYYRCYSNPYYSTISSNSNNNNTSKRIFTVKGTINKPPFNSDSNNNSTNNRKLLKKRKKRAEFEKEYESYGQSWYDFKEFEKIPTVSSGIYSLDYKLGIGGIPLNHITEIYGDSSNGKSTLSMFLASRFQNQQLNSDDHDSTNNNNNNVLYIDTENSFNTEWSEKIGVDSSKCLVIQPQCAEDAFSIIENSLIQQRFKVIILDSVSSLIPYEDLSSLYINDKSYTNFNWLQKSLERISKIIRKSGTSLIFTNQTRYSISSNNNNNNGTTSINQDPYKNNNNNINSELTSFGNSILSPFIDIGLELKRDRYLVELSNNQQQQNIVGIKCQVLIKKNNLFIHSDSMLNSNYLKLFNQWTPTFDIHFKNGINNINSDDFKLLAQELNLPTTTTNVNEIDKLIKSKLFK